MISAGICYSKNMTKRIYRHRAARRLFISALVGAIGGLLAFTLHFGSIAILVGWDIAALVFVLWVWLTIWPMNHEQTAHHALREDPSRRVAEWILIAASLASLVAIGFTVVQARQTDIELHSVIYAAISVFSVLLSWLLIHTIYVLRYATLHYSAKSGELGFDRDSQPSYGEFAYFAFTVGMTFQTSNDTVLSGAGFRKLILQHALLSYIFNTVIIATTISLVAGFGS
jgi:uncharacterized membrane protein